MISRAWGICVFSLSLCSVSVALPGKITTPEAAGVPRLLLRSDEAKKLVFINNVKVKNVTPFTSQSGRKHLRFNISIDNTTYAAIMFDGDWKTVDQKILKSGKAHVLGIWTTFKNKPSLTVRKVMKQPIKPNPNAPKKPKMLMLRSVKVLTDSVAEYKSKAQKKHVTFQFIVNQTTYQAIMYERDRTPQKVKILRSGRATLYGSWSRYKGKPSFVTERVEK